HICNEQCRTYPLAYTHLPGLIRNGYVRVPRSRYLITRVMQTKAARQKAPEKAGAVRDSIRPHPRDSCEPSIQNQSMRDQSLGEPNSTSEWLPRRTQVPAWLCTVPPAAERA